MAPIWSPDGSRLIYTANRQLVTQILFMKMQMARKKRNALCRTIREARHQTTGHETASTPVQHGVGAGICHVSELKNSLFLKTPAVLRNGHFHLMDDGWHTHRMKRKMGDFCDFFPDARGKCKSRRVEENSHAGAATARNCSIFLVKAK
jgi:hypothetical protein